MPDTCSNLLQFDTTLIKNDVASQLSFLSYVTRDNYEEMKRNYQVSLTDYFSAGYDEFEKKRLQMTKVMSLSQITTVNQTYYHHALSQNGAEAYAACIADQTRSLISAWVEKKTANTIIVIVKTGAMAREEVNFTVEPVQPLEQLKTLMAGGSQALTFPYDPKQGIALTINADARLAGGQAPVVVEVPPVRKLRLTKPTKIVTTSITCGAGGQGNTSANRIYTDGALIAEDDYYLLPETVREVSRAPVWQGGGLRYFTLVQTQTVVDGKVKRIDLHPTDIDGTSGDTQSNIRITYQATAECIRIEEE